MDSYNFHFERMNNVDLHPLSLPVNRLSPAKSGGSIDQFTHHHHHHGKGDSAYSSFSGGSNAPDPSPFLPEDLQGSSLHYTDLKYVKAIYHPSQLLQPDARSMDQLYRSVEAISKQYRHNNNKDNNSSSSNGFLAKPSSNQEEAPPPLPPPPPARLDSFITTRNLENSRGHHGPEGQRPSQQHALRVQTANPRSDLVYAWRSSQPFHRDPLNPDHTDKTTEQQKSVNILSRSPPRGTSQPENPKHKQQTAGGDGGGGHFEGHRKRAHSAHDYLTPDPAWSAGPRHVAQNLINSSIQHKGQFYFVTGVCKSSEPGLKKVSPCASEAGSETSTVVETHWLVEREEREKENKSDNLFRNPRQRHQGSLDTTADEREHLAKPQSQEEENHGYISQAPNLRVSRSFDALEQSHKNLSREIARHHSSNHPIFYCGPEENSPSLCTLPKPSHNTEITPPPVAEQANQHKREDQGKRGRRQLLGDVASEKINKETTPLLYHLTGASRAALKPRKDVDISGKGKETSHQDAQSSLGCSDRPSQADASKEAGSHPCNTLDDSFKKYYKEKLKDAQSKVLRETSFKRRDLQLSWPHRVRPRPELRPTVVLHSVSSSQDSETSTDTLTLSLSNSEGTERVSVKEEEAKEKVERERSAKESEKSGRPVNVAQPQVARIGGRRRLTPEQKKLCYSEPEKLNQLGDAPSHFSCRSLGNEKEGLLSGGEELEEHGEEGLVAARRKMFETRGRALSASSLSKTNLKHLQHKALVAYMERKTGHKVAEPQQPAPQVPPSQWQSAGGKLSDWGRPQPTGTKGPKKKHHRPHSAGRILDSSSSSIRYAQFSSAQSGSGGQSGGHSRQSSWRDMPIPSQGKSASVESLLDQPEPPEFFRNRSTSTPHAFQVYNYVNDPSSVITMETSSLHRPADAEALPRPSRVLSTPKEGPRLRVVAQRGKSMEELGVTRDAVPSVLSKSSEQLDQLGPGRDQRNVSFFREVQEGKTPGQDNVYQDRGPLGGEEDATPTTRGPADSSRSTSPASICSRTRTRSTSPGAYGVGPPVSDEVGTSGPSAEPSSPPSPRDQDTSENEIKPTSSSPLLLSSQQMMPSESTTSCSRLRTTPPLISEEREQSVDEPGETFPSNQEVSLSCGVTTDPSLWVFLPEPGSSSTEDDEVPPPSATAAEGQPPPPAPAPQASEPLTSPDAPAPDADPGPSTEGQREGERSMEDEAPEGESPGGGAEDPEMTPPVDEPRWEELVEEVVAADQSLASVLYPLTNRKTALMLMEQLLSEDTLLMEEHYKKKQEQREAADSSETGDDVEPPPSSSSSSSSSPDGENAPPPEPQNKVDVTEKKRLLVSRIEVRLRGLEDSQGALQAEVAENRASGQAVEALVRELCQPMELERYTLFIGDLERVVSLLLCLSARLARVQNALSTVNQHTDPEDKQSLDNRHRLLCKQRDDAKDLKDNLDRRERLVSTFLSRQLSAEQLQDYRRFVQTKASLLIRLKDLEEKQRLGEEQLEALVSSLPL